MGKKKCEIWLSTHSRGPKKKKEKRRKKGGKKKEKKKEKEEITPKFQL